MYLRAYVASAYGWTLDDIRKLKNSELRGYYRLARQIDAEKALRQLNMADYPRMKGEDRKKFYKNLRKIAYPNEKREVLTASQIARKLNG